MFLEQVDMFFVPLSNFVLSPGGSSDRRKAFTVVGVMVVVAILGILIALMLSADRTMVETGPAKQQMTPSRQTETASSAYCGENTGALPRGGSGNFAYCQGDYFL